VVRSWRVVTHTTGLFSYHARGVAVAVSNKLTPMIIEVTPVNKRLWVWSVDRSLSGFSADDLKVKFPVIICPVLTVYFLTYMLL